MNANSPSLKNCLPLSSCPVSRLVVNRFICQCIRHLVEFSIHVSDSPPLTLLLQQISMLATLHI